MIILIIIGVIVCVSTLFALSLGKISADGDRQEIIDVEEAVDRVPLLWTGKPPTERMSSN